MATGNQKGERFSATNMTKNFVSIQNGNLDFNFNDRGVMSIQFMKTIRVVDGRGVNGLPPGLGMFPLFHAENIAHALSAQDLKRKGVVIPMYDTEAMWLRFSAGIDSVFAIKVAAGKINAVSGLPWNEKALRVGDKQDYMVTGAQPWLDGFNVGDHTIRQFVCRPMGQGETVEEQLTGESEFGGLQIIVYPMKHGALQEYRARRKMPRMVRSCASGIGYGLSANSAQAASASMGMGMGGLIHQEIITDPHGADVWDLENGLRVFITLKDAEHLYRLLGTRYHEPRTVSQPMPVPGYPIYPPNYAGVVPGSEVLSSLNPVLLGNVKDGNW